MACWEYIFHFNLAYWLPLQTLQWKAWITINFSTKIKPCYSKSFKQWKLQWQLYICSWWKKHCCSFLAICQNKELEVKRHSPSRWTLLHSQNTYETLSMVADGPCCISARNLFLTHFQNLVILSALTFIRMQLKRKCQKYNLSSK